MGRVDSPFNWILNYEMKDKQLASVAGISYGGGSWTFSWAVAVHDGTEQVICYGRLILISHHLITPLN
jgi:hypothetical protein